MSAWRRLWQPRHPAFWLLLLFNLLSSGCAWLLQHAALSTGAKALVALCALGNVGFGLCMAWRLLRDAPVDGHPHGHTPPSA